MSIMIVKRSKQYIKNIVTLSLGIVLGITIAGGVVAFAPHVFAEDTDPKSKTCTDTNGDKKIDIKDLDPQKPCQFPDKLDSTPDGAAKTCTGGDCSGLIKNYVNPFIKLLSGLVGVIVVISIVVGGIQYASAGGDPGKVSAAKKRIYNTIIALLAYLFMFAFLNWLIPGGIV
jgi:hypothetical protein